MYIDTLKIILRFSFLVFFSFTSPLFVRSCSIFSACVFSRARLFVVLFSFSSFLNKLVQWDRRVPVRSLCEAAKRGKKQRHSRLLFLKWAADSVEVILLPIELFRFRVIFPPHSSSSDVKGFSNGIRCCLKTVARMIHLTRFHTPCTLVLEKLWSAAAIAWGSFMSRDSFLSAVAGNT